MKKPEDMTEEERYLYFATKAVPEITECAEARRDPKPTERIRRRKARKAFAKAMAENIKLFMKE